MNPARLDDTINIRCSHDCIISKLFSVLRLKNSMKNVYNFKLCYKLVQTGSYALYKNVYNYYVNWSQNSLQTGHVFIILYSDIIDTS